MRESRQERARQGRLEEHSRHADHAGHMPVQPRQTHRGAQYVRRGAARSATRRAKDRRTHRPAVGSAISRTSASGAPSWSAPAADSPTVFTGIVQGVCPVVRIDAEAGITALRVDLGDYAEGLQPGASVALNGTCLTAVESIGCDARFDLVKETRELTNLGTLRVGSLVNVERSFRVGGRSGRPRPLRPHRSFGHGYRCAGELGSPPHHRSDSSRVDALPDAQRLRGLEWGPASPFRSLTAPRNRFTVSLIPETLARTTFGEVAVGDALNLEVDAQTQAVVDTVRTMLPELVGTMSR